MSRLESILIITLIILLVAWLSVLSFFIVSIYINVKNKNFENKKTEDIGLSSPFQTDFFNKSSEHAEKVLFNKIFIQEYGEPSYYGNKLMDIIYKLNDDTKRSIVTAIKFMSIEPQTTRINENNFRIMAVQEKVPVWFIILREATKKVVPYLIEDQSQINSNIVSINRVA